MREIALNILDIAENSVKAGASLIEIEAASACGILTVAVTDDGCGMDAEFLARVADPFTTTRTTRKVGMGIPLFKMAAETAGGTFSIESAKGKGTRVKATFEIGHIDRAPLGDLGSTASALLSDAYDFVLTVSAEYGKYVFDTRELKKELDGIPADSPEIVAFVREMINENIKAIGGEKL